MPPAFGASSRGGKQPARGGQANANSSRGNQNQAKNAGNMPYYQIRGNDSNDFMQDRMRAFGNDYLNDQEAEQKLRSGQKYQKGGLGFEGNSGGNRGGGGNSKNRGGGSSNRGGGGGAFNRGGPSGGNNNNNRNQPGPSKPKVSPVELAFGDIFSEYEAENGAKQYTCKLCKVSDLPVTNMETHKAGKRHLQQVKLLQEQLSGITRKGRVEDLLRK